MTILYINSNDVLLSLSADDPTLRQYCSDPSVPPPLSVLRSLLLKAGFRGSPIELEVYRSDDLLLVFARIPNGPLRRRLSPNHPRLLLSRRNR